MEVQASASEKAASRTTTGTCQMDFGEVHSPRAQGTVTGPMRSRWSSYTEVGVAAAVLGQLG